MGIKKLIDALPGSKARFEAAYKKERPADVAAPKRGKGQSPPDWGGEWPKVGGKRVTIIEQDTGRVVPRKRGR